MDSKVNKKSYKKPLKEACLNIDLDLSRTKLEHNDPKEPNSEAMNEILIRSQHVHNQHKCLEDMLNVYKKCNHDYFLQQFILKAKYILKHDYKNSFVKNCILFLSRFVITIDNEAKQFNTSSEDLNSSTCEVTLTESMIGASTFLDQLVSKFLINHLESSLLDLRYNICFLLSKIFQEVTDIGHEMYSVLIQALTNRMTDRSHAVRAVATLALRRFQDPKDSNDQVMMAYHFHLCKDPSHKVRLSVLSCIEPCESTISDIINKTRDVQALIRKAAYIKLATLDARKLLTSEQRFMILKDGLNDKNQFVRKVVEIRLILSWLKIYEDDIFLFLKDFDIESDVEDIEKIVKVILQHCMTQKSIDFGTKLHSLVFDFKQKYLDKEKLILSQHFTSKKVFLWRLLNCFIKENETQFLQSCQLESICKNKPSQNITHLNSSQADDYKESFDPNGSTEAEEMSEYLLPEFPHFCNFLQKFINDIDTDDVNEASLIESEFIFDQLLKFLLLYDIGDDAQKLAFLKVIKSIIFSSYMFLKFEDCINPAIHLAASKIYKNSLKLLEFIADVSNQICDNIADNETDQRCSSPTFDATLMEKWEMEYATVIMDLEEQKDLLDQALADQNYSRAHQLKQKLDELDQKKRTMMQQRLDPSLFMENQTLNETVSNQAQPQQQVDLTQSPEALLKCLQIFTGCLEYGHFNSINGIILTHIERVGLPGILSSEPRIRKLAVKSLGLSCLLSSSLFQRHYNLFIQIIKHDEEEVRLVGLESLLDSLCEHGIGALVESEEHNTLSSLEANNEPKMSEEKSSQLSSLSDQNRLINSIIELLLDLTLNSEFDSLKKLAVEGIGKMMVCGMISSHLLSRLIIIWYLPESPSFITQFLGTFIPLFVCSETKYLNKNNGSVITGQTCLIESILETLLMIYETKLEMKSNSKSFESIKHFSSLCEPRKLLTIDIKQMLSSLSNLLDKVHHGNFFTLFCQKILNALLLSSSSLSKQNKEKDYHTSQDLLMDYFVKTTANLDLTLVETAQRIELTRFVNSILCHIKPHDSSKTSKKKIDQFGRCCQNLVKNLQANNFETKSKEKEKKRTSVINSMEDNEENYYQAEIDNQSEEEEEEDDDDNDNDNDDDEEAEE